MNDEHYLVLSGLVGEVVTSNSQTFEGYLEAYEPEANDGLGWVSVTDDVNKARRFPSIAAAMDCWNQIPANRPIRDYDGRPNRPLTAFNVTLERCSPR